MQFKLNRNETREGAFLKLSKAYSEREHAVPRYKNEGKRVAGCLGHDVPEEILIAAGYLPVQICGEPGKETPNADKYLELAFDKGARSQFERIVNGTYEFLDHLVISNSSDILVRMFYYLRQIINVESHIPVPSSLYFFDFKFSKYRTSTLYNRERILDFKNAVEKWCGHTILNDTLSKAIALCNESRALLSEMNKHRISEAVRISGSQALQIIGASMFMPKEEYNLLLSDLLSEIESEPVLPGLRVYLSGSNHDQLDFYKLVESCGAVIVGEDHDWGTRHFMGSISTSSEPCASIADYYHLRFAGSKKSLVSERVSLIKKQVRETGAQAVIFFIQESDDAVSWDYPEQKREIEAMGIPTLVLKRQPYDMKSSQGLHDKVSRFIESANKQPGRD